MTNLEKYFGTPEKAMDSFEQCGLMFCPLYKFGNMKTCADCPDDDNEVCSSEIIEWLKQEAE